MVILSFFVYLSRCAHNYKTQFPFSLTRITVCFLFASPLQKANFLSSRVCPSRAFDPNGFNYLFIYIKPYTVALRPLLLFGKRLSYLITYPTRTRYHFRSESSFVNAFLCGSTCSFSFGFYLPIGLYLPFCTYSIAQKKRNCNMANCKNFTIYFCLICRNLPIITIFSLQTRGRCDIINLWACFIGRFFI